MLAQFAHCAAALGSRGAERKQSATNQGTGKNFCVMRAEVKITVKE